MAMNTKMIKDKGLVSKLPKGTFIPIKLATMVGIEITIVKPARNFIIVFKLLEMIVPKISMVLVRILL
jgi:hypothetical protein